jgi:hypothetical protein
MTREEAEKSREKWDDLCSQNTYRRTAEMMNYGK